MLNNQKWSRAMEKIRHSSIIATYKNKNVDEWREIILFANQQNSNMQKCADYWLSSMPLLFDLLWQCSVLVLYILLFVLNAFYVDSMILYEKFTIILSTNESGVSWTSEGCLLCDYTHLLLLWWQLNVRTAPGTNMQRWCCVCEFNVNRTAILHYTYIQLSQYRHRRR